MNGGARPGAGRPKGSQNRLNRLIKLKAVKTGILPREMMLEMARYHYARAEALKAEKPTKNRPPETIEAEIRLEHQYAQSHAAKAAEFIHSKPAQAQNVNLTGTLTLAQLLDQAIPAPANSNAVDETEEKAGAVRE